jgi:hypothetical protein
MSFEKSGLRAGTVTDASGMCRSDRTRTSAATGQRLRPPHLRTSLKNDDGARTLCRTKAPPLSSRLRQSTTRGPTCIDLVRTCGVHEITGELVDPQPVTEFYPGATDEHVWGLWRVPTLAELVSTWPFKTARADDSEWWFPTIEELRPARRAARVRESKSR